MPRIEVGPASVEPASAAPVVLVNFVDFGDLGEMQLNGRAAAITNPATGTGGEPILRLIDSTYRQRASAFWTRPVDLGTTADPLWWSSTFAFRFSSIRRSGAAGIVFTLATSPSALGGSAGRIGYGGIANSVGVEFDNWRNRGSDPDSNHIGINVGGFRQQSRAADGCRQPRERQHLDGMGRLRRHDADLGSSSQRRRAAAR